MMSDAVSYDRRSFIINGKPTIIFSGSVHYVRVHPSKWTALFQTFLDAGLNTVETYIFWGLHDAPPPVFANDETASKHLFHDRLDLFAFIFAAAEAGLHVILRMGPYICAEVNYGGFPVRLRDVPEMRFRTINEPFLKEVESWIMRIADGLLERKLLASQGGPVILFQLENEYSMVSHKYGESGVQYLQWMADLQKKLSFNVPAIMCYGAAEGVVETINSFYAHELISGLRDVHSGQPPVWTECWTGWYDVWGAPHHSRPIPDLLYAVARFFASGGAGVNYYMWMGGTNYGRESMYLQITSYDYDAPIDEFYNHTTKSRRLAQLHKVLKTAFESAFHKSREQDPPCIDGVILWGNTAFFCNDSHTGRDDFLFEGKRYPRTILPKSIHIVDIHSGKLLFDTAEIPPDDVVTRSIEPVSVVYAPWTVIPEPLISPSSVETTVQQGNQARPLVTCESPPELVSLTRGSSDYAMYTAQFLVGDGPGKLQMEVADFASVFIDENYVGGTVGPLWEDRWPNRWNAYDDGGPGTGLEIKIPHLSAGTIDVCVVVSSLGMVKGDWQLGERNMLEEKKGLLADIDLRAHDNSWAAERKSSWHALGKLHGEVSMWGSKLGLKGAVDGAATMEHKYAITAPVWFGTTLKVRTRSDGWVLDLSQVGKGMLFVNGELLGRFWNIRGTRPRNGFLDGSPIVQVGDRNEPSQRYYHVPGWLCAKNSSPDGHFFLHIVLFVERGPIPTGPIPLLSTKIDDTGN